MRYLQIILFLLFASVLYATEPNSAGIPERTVEEEAQKMTEMLARELGDLTQEQRVQVYELNLQLATQRRQSNTRVQELERMMDAMNALKKILTPDQYDRFANKQVDRRPRKGGGELHSPGPPREPQR